MKKAEWAPGVYESFMETYDYMTCQRPDGSYYGTGGTCRKGTEATLPKKEKSTKSKAKEMAAQARKEAGAETGPGSMRDRFAKAKKVLGEGSYGEVKETASGTVIKKGMIGAKEIEIQQKLAGVDGVPKIIGVQYSSKAFKDRGGDRTGIVEMEKAKGTALMNQQMKLDHNIKGKTAGKVLDEYMRLRKDVHTRGVAHGDMHEGNVTWNGKKMGLIDFGLSKSGYKNALAEALGTNERDPRAAYLIDGLKRDGAVSKKEQRFQSNLAKVEKKAKGNISEKKAQQLLEELYSGV